MDLETVADELYGLRPDEFTAARDQRAAQAREDGDSPLAERIKALRRPGLAAWACNLLVREQPDEVEPLVQLGEGLRQAHRGLDGERLRELSRQRHALIHALASQAARLAEEAGHPIGEGARREIEQTLHAVLADERAARAWASGRLTKALSETTGFDVVAVAADAAPPRRATTPRTPAKPPRGDRDTRADERAEERRRQKLAEARRDAEEAGRRLRDREKEAAAADRDAEQAGKLTGELERRLEELAQERERTEERHRGARAEEREAHDRARAAQRAVREASGRAETAAALVERLTGERRDHRGTEGGDG
ncbi:hypothetical protein ACOBQB_02955 [Streptomyces sp. G5(2025)]|uniref:hypothetical protein n=1 Tax=Streptomyces sp. G5(2025) TaxID=3406628 RepID=UPI003C1C0D14